MSKHIPRLLSHDELQRMLEEHARFNATDGREGQQLDLSGYVIEDFDFSTHDVENLIHARGSVFTRCGFRGCDLYHVYFNDSKLIAADFRDAMLAKAEFHGVDASRACFDNAKMGSAEFIEANLSGAAFRNADLYSCIISNCDLTNAVFDDADLGDAAIRDNTESGTSWRNVKGRSVAA